MMFDDQFERTFRRLSHPFFAMDDIFDDIRGDTVQTYGPYYYGFVKTVGPDGKPSVTEWGNTNGLSSIADSNVREPYVDVSVNEKEHTMKLITEMPGIEKSDIKVNVSDKLVSISAEHGDRKYSTKIPLQYKVDENSAKAKYTNGVLALTLNLAKEIPKGKVVSVE